MECNFITWLHDWQEIIGAAIGGAMGFVGAYWVAHNAKSREEIIAAKIIITYLMAIQEKTRAQDEAMQASSIPEENKEQEFAFRYLLRKPIPSPLIDMAMATASTLPNKLPALLANFGLIYRNVEDSAARLLEQMIIAERNNTKLSATLTINSDIHNIYQGAHQASELAEQIIPLLNKSVISRVRLFHNVFSSFSHEKNCDCCCRRNQ